MTDKDQVLKPVTEPEVTPTKVKSEKDETGDTSTDDFEEDNEKVTCDMECDCENFDMSLCENCHLGIAESENKLLEARKSSSVSTKNQNSEIGKDQEVPENQIPAHQNSAQYAVEKGVHNEEQTSVAEPEVKPTKVKSEKDETGDTSTDDFEEDNEKVTCDMECDCENFDMSLCENCHLGIAESENKLLEARKSSSVSTKNQNSEIGKDQEVPENQIPELQNSAQYAVEKGEHNEEQTSVTEPEVTPTKVKPYKFEIVGASTDYWAKDNDEGQKIS